MLYICNRFTNRLWIKKSELGSETLSEIIVKTVKISGAIISGPIPLPPRKKLFLHKQTNSKVLGSAPDASHKYWSNEFSYSKIWVLSLNLSLLNERRCSDQTHTNNFLIKKVSIAQHWALRLIYKELSYDFA